MISKNRIIAAARGFFEAIARARVNSVLLGFGREKAEELGYSYDALLLGPSAWPWRNTTQHRALDVGGTVIELKKPLIDKTDRSLAKDDQLDQAIFRDHSEIIPADQTAA